MADGVYYTLLALAVLVAVFFTLLILVTSKGDAMSAGGGQIRTSFKGKATIDEQISRVTLIMGVVFMVLMLGLDVANQMRVRTGQLNLGVPAAKSAPANPETPAPSSTPPGAPATQSAPPGAPQVPAPSPPAKP